MKVTFFVCLTGIFLWASWLFWWNRERVREAWSCVCLSCTCTSCRCLVWIYDASRLILSHIAPSACLVLTCTAPLGSLSSWIVSCPSWGPPTTKCCSSVKWQHSWPSWRTTLPTGASNTCVWMVRHLWPRPRQISSQLYENDLIASLQMNAWNSHTHKYCIKIDFLTL